MRANNRWFKITVFLFAFSLLVAAYGGTLRNAQSHAASLEAERLADLAEMRDLTLQLETAQDTLAAAEEFISELRAKLAKNRMNFCRHKKSSAPLR